MTEIEMTVQNASKTINHLEKIYKTESNVINPKITVTEYQLLQLVKGLFSTVEILQEEINTLEKINSLVETK
jgi:hypothetical protein